MYTNTTAVSTYITELLRSGHTVSVFTDTYDDDKPVEFHSSHLHIYIVPRDIRRNGFRTFSPLTFHRKLSQFISQHLSDIDVLHAQWTYEYALAAKRFADRLPVFCTVRDWCPYILSLQQGWKVKLRWYFYLYIFRRVMFANKIHFIANSEYTYRRIITDYPNKDVSIIYNPIDKAIVLDSPTPKLDHPVFISICHVISDTRKNIATLLQAFSLFRRQHPDAELLLVGEYTEDTTVYDYAQSNSLSEGVKFLGRIPHSQLISVIDTATCLIHPSFEETFGNILLEGMSRCIPVIGGKDSGAVPQVLDDGNCGILCDVSSADSMCQAMLQTLDHDFTTSLVQRATHRINTLYRSDVTMQQTVKLYDETLTLRNAKATKTKR